MTERDGPYVSGLDSQTTDKHKDNGSKKLGQRWTNNPLVNRIRPAMVDEWV
jgi:hypothetical protein